MAPVFGVNRAGWKFFAPLAVVTIILGLTPLYWLALLPAILAAYVLYFFRDPNRKTPNIPHSICAPADGKVVSVLEVPCPEMPEGRALRIAIFLNIFNVHVQRSPMAGVVRSVVHRSGKMINALNEKCSEENEAVTVWLDTAHGPIGVRQITGAIARRIICAVEPGDELQRGERYGIIQFGSRVEVFLPLDATVKVQPGQKVTGGLNCMAVLSEDMVKRGLSREAVERPDMLVGSRP